MIPGKVQGDVGGGENPFSPHDFFHLIFFIFLFLRHYGALHRQARKYSSVTQLSPNIAHMQLA